MLPIRTLLTPAGVPEHRSVQALELDLPPGATRLRLRVEARPAAAAPQLWPYWSRLSFD